MNGDTEIPDQGIEVITDMSLKIGPVVSELIFEKQHIRIENGKLVKYGKVKVIRKKLPKLGQ